MSTTSCSKTFNAGLKKPICITSALLNSIMSTTDEKMKGKSLDEKHPTHSKISLLNSDPLCSNVDSKHSSEKTGSQLCKVKGTREDSDKEKLSRDSGISSLPSQCSTSPGNRSSLSNISCSTPLSRSSTGSNTSRLTVGSESSDDTIKTPNHSSCITPESTPIRFSTPNVIVNDNGVPSSGEVDQVNGTIVPKHVVDIHDIQETVDDRRPYKRSFNDSSEQSPTSSPNCSTFNTPDSSPNEYGPFAKRFKSKWRDSSSWYSSPDESLPASPRCRFGGNAESDSVQPELIGYQMVGDSQFCRFGQQLLGLQRVYMPNSSGRIGICVSGQTITDLHKRVKEKFYPISEKIILMIGTNDFLRSVDVKTMCKELSALITTLQETVKNIVLLTLPPIPKLEKKQRAYHFTMLNQYNTYIRSLDNNDQLRIADVSPLYMTSTPFQKCRMNYFELYFNGPQQRLDMIHLNQAGLEVIRKYILDHFYIN